MIIAYWFYEFILCLRSCYNGPLIEYSSSDFCVACTPLLLVTAFFILAIAYFFVFILLNYFTLSTSAAMYKCICEHIKFKFFSSKNGFSTIDLMIIN